MIRRLRCTRSCSRIVASLTFIAIAAPLACADSAALDPEPAPAPDAAVLPKAAPLEDAGVDVDAADDVTIAPCSSGGFCYEPLPVPVSLESISATSMDDAWAAGGDAIVRWNGKAWQPVYQYDATQSGTTVTFRAVIVAKPDDVWAIGSTSIFGQSLVVRYSQRDGGPPAFRERFADEGVATAGWVTSSSDALWAIGTSGAVVRFRETDDGTMAVDRWTPQGEPEDGAFYAWYGLWGFGADDVYVAGSACSFGQCTGLVAHYDGASWSITTVDDSSMVTGMFGTRAADQPKQLWIEILDPTMMARSIRLVPVSSDGSLGAPVLERNASGCGWFTGSAVGPNAAWISDGCLVHRWNGTTLEVTPIAVNGEPPGRVNALWAASANAAWVVGTALPYKGPNLPLLGFAARRESADGGAP